jgi:hypothetical protein
MMIARSIDRSIDRTDRRARTSDDDGNDDE